MQTDSDNAGLQQWEEVVTASNPAQVAYSFNKSFPTDVYEFDTRTYYDVYTFADLASRTFVAEGNVAASDRSTNAIGQVTGRSERVSGNGTAGVTGSDWLTTTFFYNERGNLIQTQADVFPTGNERLTNEVDFTGRVVTSMQTHTFPQATVPTHVVWRENSYDNMGRLTNIWQSVTDKNASGQVVNNQPTILLAKYEYNELGQLVDKKLHSDDSGATFLQSVDYRYNIRGWLTNINNRDLSNNVEFDSDGVAPNTDNLGEQVALMPTMPTALRYRPTSLALNSNTIKTRASASLLDKGPYPTKPSIMATWQRHYGEAVMPKPGKSFGATPTATTR